MRTPNWIGSGSAWQSHPRSPPSRSRSAGRAPTLPHAEQLERAGVPCAHHLAHGQVLSLLQLRIGGQDPLSRLARTLVQLLIAKRIGDAKCRNSVLPFAKQVAHPTELHVGARDREAILRVTENLKTAR